MPAARRFPPPWSVEEGETYFIVKDSAGQKLAYVYFEEEPGRRRRYQGRSAADRGEYRQAAGAARGTVKRN